VYSTEEHYLGYFVDDKEMNFQCNKRREIMPKGIMGSSIISLVNKLNLFTAISKMERCCLFKDSSFFNERSLILKKFTINDLFIGQSSSIKKSFLESDVINFARISGDFNPAHLDEQYAKETIFKKRIVHGMLVGSLFSAILGTKLPGLGSIYTFQSLKFTKPVYLNEEITATVIVKEVIVEKNRVILECVAKNERDEVVIVGEATIMAPR